MFDGIEDHGQRLDFLPVGTHELELVNIEIFKNSHTNLPGCRATVEVVSTTSSETAPGRRHVCIHSQTDPRYKYWLGDMRSLIAAFLDEPVNSVDAAGAAKFVASFAKNKEEGLFDGITFQAVTVSDKKKSGEDFLKNTYFPAPVDEAE